MQPPAIPSSQAPGVSVISSRSVQKSFLALLKSLHRGEVRKVASEVLSRRINFTDLSNFLITERLAVYFYSSVLDLKIQALFPRDFMTRIEDQYLQQQRRNLKLSQSLQEIDAAFDTANIDYLLLKGLHVAEAAWHGMDSRFTWDLDLLVRQKCWHAAGNILANLGYRKPPNVLGLDRMIHYFTHAMAMERGGDLFLDLHWTFRKLPGVRIDCDRIWSRSGTFQFGGLECRVPCDDDLLLLILLGIADDKNRGKGKVRSFWDIYLLLQKMTGVNWPSFLSEREREGLLPLVANSLDLVLRQLDCRKEFPQLGQVLERYGDVLLSNDTTPARYVPHGLHQILVNRWWFARLQPKPLWYYCFWWLITLPMRYLFTQSR